MELIVGLVFNVITILFASIATLLIYSLLMITTETKRYENGLMALLGLSKCGYASMILLQAFMFVLPAIFFGFCFSIPALAFVYDNLFTTSMGFTPKLFPGGMACLLALAIGLLIPVFGSIIPIKIALSKTLSEQLASTHTTSGSVISIEDSSSVKKAPYVTIGVITVVYGVFLYYALPLALISSNYKLILDVLFFLLIGLLFGLALLASNLQGLFQFLLSRLMLFWEKRSMLIMLDKNFVAHKARNKLTAIIFSLTLGTVIFI
jgi:hypothetical protein